MKLAVIDCGTNTFNLLIVEVNKGTGAYQKLFSTRIPVRLGDTSINQGFIAQVPFMRGIDAISSFRATIREHNVQLVQAFATSAIRDAQNGNDFVKVVREQFDIEIQVIDGAREADLIYLAIRAAVQLNNELSLVMDIGGGSTEFIIADKDQILWKDSFRIGAARLLERFPHSNPITVSEIQQIRGHLEERLGPLAEAVERYRPVELIGSSGAFESFIEMINGELGGEPFLGEKTEYTIAPSDYKKISAMVLASDLEARKRIKGLVPMRLDMIVICCIMVDFVLERFALTRLRVSSFSLKEGAMLEFIQKSQNS